MAPRVRGRRRREPPPARLTCRRRQAGTLQAPRTRSHPAEATLTVDIKTMTQNNLEVPARDDFRGRPTPSGQCQRPRLHDTEAGREASLGGDRPVLGQLQTGVNRGRSRPAGQGAHGDTPPERPGAPCEQLPARSCVSAPGPGPSPLPSPTILHCAFFSSRDLPCLFSGSAFSPRQAAASRTQLGPRRPRGCLEARGVRGRAAPSCTVHASAGETCPRRGASGPAPSARRTRLRGEHAADRCRPHKGHFLQQRSPENRWTKDARHRETRPSERFRGAPGARGPAEGASGGAGGKAGPAAREPPRTERQGSQAAGSGREMGNVLLESVQQGQEHS